MPPILFRPVIYLQGLNPLGFLFFTFGPFTIGREVVFRSGVSGSEFVAHWCSHYTFQGGKTGEGAMRHGRLRSLPPDQSADSDKTGAVSRLIAHLTMPRNVQDHAPIDPGGGDPAPKLRIQDRIGVEVTKAFLEALNDPVISG